MSRHNTVGKVATRVWGQGDTTFVSYHRTTVVMFNREEIVLDNGGYRTATTKVRMNQASNQFGLGYGVYQEKGNWFVSYQGLKIPFNDKTLRLSR